MPFSRWKSDVSGELKIPVIWRVHNAYSVTRKGRPEFQRALLVPAFSRRQVQQHHHYSWRGTIRIDISRKRHCEEIIPRTVKSSTVTGLGLRLKGNDHSIICQVCQLLIIFVNYLWHLSVRNVDARLDHFFFIVRKLDRLIWTRVK